MEPDMGMDDLDLGGLGDEEEEQPLTEDIVESLLDEVLGEMMSAEEDEEEPAEEEEDEEELTEELIASAIEEVLKVDFKAVPSGYTIGNPVELKAQQDAMIAKMRDTEFAKKEKEHQKAIKDLVSLQEKNLAKDKKIKDAMKVIDLLQKKLNETNLINAKLLYTNKVLNSDSLNERQKEKVVDAISRAGTVQEAKVIFETLQGTVQSDRNKRQPKSLSEAVTRTSSTFMPRRTEVLQESQLPEVDRWAILAGIKK
jgi:hypothetical protein